MSGRFREALLLYANWYWTDQLEHAGEDEDEVILGLGRIVALY
jgi:hypothetical protein